MKITETTTPVERTYDIQGVTASQLRILRTALSDYALQESQERRKQADHRQSISNDMKNEQKNTPSKEESEANDMLGLIRTAERATLNLNMGGVSI